jgi:hypothetical protein
MLFAVPTLKNGIVRHYIIYSLAALLFGCSNQGVATYRVTGTVKLSDGKPLAGGRILFQPTGEVSHSARGIIAQDGSFQLTTFEPNDGAIPGEHKVVITPAVPEEAMDNPAAIARYRSLLDARYQNVDTTPLKYTVQPDNSQNHFDIVLEPSRTATK